MKDSKKFITVQHVVSKRKKEMHIDVFNSLSKIVVDDGKGTKKTYPNQGWVRVAKVAKDETADAVLKDAQGGSEGTPDDPMTVDEMIETYSLKELKIQATELDLAIGGSKTDIATRILNHYKAEA